MLWPERREKDPIFANDNGPGVGIIDRVTVDSYVEIAEGYIPPHLRGLVGLGRRLFPFLVGGSNYGVRIGPFPKGTPVSLLTNLDVLGVDLPESEQRAHRQKLFTLLKRAKSELKADKDLGAAMGRLVNEMLALSKCKDFVVNKGHYFGTQFMEPDEPGLSDSDKRALIGLIKTF
jgi:hypothetical protein